MIDIRELRIGNIVSTNRGNGFVSNLRLIDDKDKTFDNLPISVSLYHGTEYEVDEVDLLPVQLTEEMLFKYGFEEQELFEDESPFFVIKDFSLSTDSFAKEKFFYDSDTEIKYLHQLQNIYFALTGKELEF